MMQSQRNPEGKEVELCSGHRGEKVGDTVGDFLNVEVCRRDKAL